MGSITVSPVYFAENIISELVTRLISELSKITSDFEIILVEDGSTDNSWQQIEENCKKHKDVKGIKLSKNFGQHHAITAGLDVCNGDWVVVMDCDLQDDPKEIKKLYEKAQQGYDIVFAKRSYRKDSFLKKLSSKLFYGLFSYLSDLKQDNTIANFGIYSRKAINTIKSIREPFRAFSPMARWIGFNKSAVYVEHSQRFEGRSTYNWKRLLNLALEISIAYSDKPLRLTIKLGFITSLISVLIGIYYLWQYFVGIIQVSGFTTIVVSMWFLGGLIIMILGIIGLYLSKVFDGVKKRPLYIIDKTTNFKE